MPRAARNFSSHHHPTTRAMNQYITYNEHYKVLICSQHEYALTPDWVLRHFQEFHKSIPFETRQLIVEHSKSLDLVSPENIATPIELVPCVDGLAIVHGFQCHYEGCSELRSTERSIKEHCRKNHEWKAKMGAMWRTQPYQTFFHGPHRKYIDTIAG